MHSHFVGFVMSRLIYMSACEQRFVGTDIPVDESKQWRCCYGESLGKNICASSRKNLYSGVSDQVRLELACSATDTSWSLEILDIETRGILLSK